MVFSKDLSQLLLVPEGKEGAATLPDSTQTVPAGAFSHSARLTSVSVGDSCAVYSSGEGILYSKDKATLLACPAGYGDSVVIPESVQVIGPKAFAGCELESVVALGGVSTIDLSAFSDSIKASTVVVLAAGSGYDMRKAVWESAGFTHFEQPALPGDIQAPASDTTGLTYELLPDYTLAVSWQGDVSPEPDLVIPPSAEIKGVFYRVSTIADNAFRGQTSLTSVAIPSSVSSVGPNAFQGCTSLAAVTLEEGLVRIGPSTFEATAFEELYLPVSLRAIDTRAFADCTSLSRIVALGDIPRVSEDAISGCSGMSILTPYREDNLYPWTPGVFALGNHVEPYGLFLSEAPLELEVGQSADLFEGGIYEMPQGCEVVYSYPAACVSVDADGIAVGKGAGVADVMATLLVGDEGLAQASRSMTVVQESADTSRDAISRANVFPVSTPLSGVRLLADGTGIAPRAVTVPLTDLAFTLLADGTYSVGAVNRSTIAGDLVIPATYNGKSVTVIGRSAFREATGLTSVSLPASLKTIEVEAFRKCSNLAGSLTIPTSVTSIGERAFQGCAGFTGSLTIPNSVTSIGGLAFWDCAGFKGSLAIPNSVKTIGEYAFSSCSGLTGTLTIPSSVTSVEDSAFYECSSLEKVIWQSASPIIGTALGGTFYNCTKLTSVELSSAVAVVNAYAFGNCKALVSIICKGTSATIAPDAFQNKAAVVDLPKNASRTVWTGAGFSKFNNYVSFAANGGTPTPADQRVVTGFAATQPPAMSRSGYRFLGWYQESGLANPWSFTSTVSSDITLYAGWTDTCTITYNGNGGTLVGGATATVKVGASAIRPTNPTRTGYTFVNWYTAASGGSIYGFGAMNADATVFAQWSINTYTITFDGNGGAPATSSKTADYNTTITAPANPSKTGYTFRGWWTEKTGGTQFNANSAIVANATYYARWEINTYAITFHPNNSGADFQQQITYNNLATTPSGIVKTGHTLTAWCSDVGLAQAYNFSTPVTSNKELWAKWTANTYTVTYESAGGTSVAPAAGTFGQKITQPTPGPTRPGYTFASWYSSDLARAWNFASDLVPAKSFMLQARWTGTPYLIGYDANGADTGAVPQGVEPSMARPLIFPEQEVLRASATPSQGGTLKQTARAKRSRPDKRTFSMFLKTVPLR